MRTIKPREFTGSRAWQALDFVLFDDDTIRLHWTDQPYKWHVNDGPEVFVVLDGAVDMHTRSGGVESVERLAPGDIFHAQDGDAHVAHPVGPARVLVIERAGRV